MNPRVAPSTIAAIATPPGKGAIAVVRVSGPLVPEVAVRLVHTRTPLKPRVATYATILDDRGTPLDRGLVILFPAPHSYTGETLLELHVHGSPVVTRELMRALFACGAQLAEPGEFTRRAFFNEKIGLQAAAAVADVIDAETAAAARAAVSNIGTGLAEAIGALRGRLAELLEELAASIDFPDEVAALEPAQVDQSLTWISKQLEEMRRDGELGRILRDGVDVAIVGPPNAGKSSLLNALLGEDRAIVSDLPGTTRDTIEESLSIGGAPVRLVDTAGIREHADRIEAIGIERTRRALQRATIAIIVIDGSRPLCADAHHLIEQTSGTKRVVFLNKSDIGDAGTRELNDRSAIVGSVRTGAGIEGVRDAVAALGWGGGSIEVERPHPASLRDYEAVAEALGALARAHRTLSDGQPVDFTTGELQCAFSALGHVTERVAAEEILGGVFSRFCIGK